MTHFPNDQRSICGSAVDVCLYIIRVKLALGSSFCQKCGEPRCIAYHVNMLKKDVNRHKEDAAVVENHELAAVITVVNDGEIGVDEEMLELFNSKQKETYKDVKVN